MLRRTGSEAELSINPRSKTCKRVALAMSKRLQKDTNPKRFRRCWLYVYHRAGVGWQFRASISPLPCTVYLFSLKSLTSANPLHVKDLFDCNNSFAGLCLLKGNLRTLGNWSFLAGSPTPNPLVLSGNPIGLGGENLRDVEWKCYFTTQHKLKMTLRGECQPLLKIDRCKIPNCTSLACWRKGQESRLSAVAAPAHQSGWSASELPAHGNLLLLAGLRNAQTQNRAGLVKLDRRSR